MGISIFKNANFLTILMDIKAAQMLVLRLQEVFIQFSKYVSTMLTIKDCEFYKNTALPIDALDPIEIMNFTQWNGNGLGGGIGILLLKNSSHVTINIMNCTFQKNLAPWGGGLCIYLQTQTSSNRVTIARSSLMENSARNDGSVMNY